MTRVGERVFPPNKRRMPWLWFFPTGWSSKFVFSETLYAAVRQRVQARSHVRVLVLSSILSGVFYMLSRFPCVPVQKSRNRSG